MIRAVDWEHTSATGVEFLGNTAPPYPIRTWRIQEDFSTGVLWSDGVEEVIPDFDLKESINV